MKSSMASTILFAAAFVVAMVARLGRGAEETGAVEATRPAVSEGTWFWPDPFPHLGYDERQGRDWMFVRIASDRQAMSPMKISDPQDIESIYHSIYHVAEEEAIASGKEVKWPAVREEVEALLSREQVARIEQLIIQRLGYRAFSDADVAKRLQLTQEQQQEMSSLVEQYQFLVSDNQAELGRAWHRAARRLDGEELASRVKELIAQKFARDHAFLLQLWSGIHRVLSEGQRQVFDATRGPMPQSLREILPKLNGNPGLTQENRTISYRRRGSLPATSETVDINSPSDQDAQLAWWELMHDNGHDVDPDQVRQLRIIKEKLVDFIDPPRVFPMVGLARLHHSHYKCTIWSGKDEVDAVYLDRTHFHGVTEGEFNAQCELTEQLIRIPVEQSQ